MQARARRTREKIIAEAKRAFSERGFEATNLTEHILTPAGVSVGSFYHQFTNKREVLLEIFAATVTVRHQRIRDRLRSLDARSFADAYRFVLEVLLDDVEGDPEVWRIQWREHESPDPDIRERALVGVDGWVEIVLQMMVPFHGDTGGDEARRRNVATMCVLCASGMIREYSHYDTDRQHATRAELLDGCVAFVDAAVTGLLGPAR